MIASHYISSLDSKMGILLFDKHECGLYLESMDLFPVPLLSTLSAPWWLCGNKNHQDLHFVGGGLGGIWTHDPSDANRIFNQTKLPALSNAVMLILLPIKLSLSCCSF